MDNHWVKSTTSTSRTNSSANDDFCEIIIDYNSYLPKQSYKRETLTILLKVNKYINMTHQCLESGLIIRDLRCCIDNFKNYESLDNILWKFQKRHIALGQTMKNKVTSFVLGQKCHFWGLFYPQQADAWPTMHNTVTIFASLIDLVIITKII